MTAITVSCVVFPNSLKITAAVALAVASVCALKRLRLDGNLIFLFLLWMASAIITSVYSLLGVVHGAPPEAAGQVFVTYIAFPLAWMIVLAYTLQIFSVKVIVNALILAGFIGCLSILVFYFAFFRGWETVALFFIEDPNVDTNTQGYVATRMYIYGSLIFIAGGYVASMSLRGGSSLKYLLLPAFVLAALSSGRSALILAILLGLAISGITLLRRVGRLIGPAVLKGALLLLLSCTVVVVVMQRFDLELLRLIGPVIEKIVTAGGLGRRPQLLPLLDGMGDNFGLGSGHGIGVSYIASETYPWRYEMVWLASAFRVGVVGAFVYALPFVLALLVGAQSLLKGTLNEDEAFLLGGLISAFVASNTNPYVEAFVFQWMYVLPVLYFLSKKFIAVPLWKSSTTSAQEREAARSRCTRLATVHRTDSRSR